MNIHDVYIKYQTPQNLRKHMLRVSALASILLDHWSGPLVVTEAIIRASALHDIAKPLSFDLAKQKLFGVSEEEIEHIRQFQHILKKNYGESEHQAMIGICKEVGCDERIIQILDNHEWKYVPKLLSESSWEPLLTIYCDMRIGPNGILPLQERIEDLAKRTDRSNYTENLRNGTALEQKITKSVSLDVNSITDPQLHERFAHILDIEL